MNQYTDERQELFFEPIETIDELRLWLKVFLNIELPDESVDDESTSNPLKFVWEVYSSMKDKTGPKRFVAACARNTGKTLTACIIRFLGMVHYRRNGTHLAATLEQSQSATLYFEEFLSIPEILPYVKINNTRTKELSGMPPNSWTNLGKCKVRVATATIRGVNSQRGSLNFVDECDLVDASILSEKAWIADPTPEGLPPVEVSLSSRKTNSGPIQRLISEAESGDNSIALHKWSLVDWMRQCPESVCRSKDGGASLWVNTENLKIVWGIDGASSLSDVEKQVQKQYCAFEGCKDCAAVIACLGRAQKRKSHDGRLRDAFFVGNVLKETADPSVIIAQGLNWRPQTSAVVFRMFNRRTHFLNAINFYKWCIGSYFVPSWSTQEEVDRVVKTSDTSELAVFTPTKIQIYQALREAGWRVHFGVDWGSIDPAVCVVGCYHKPTRRLVILHNVAHTGFPNEDFAKFIASSVHPSFPCDLVCPDMADINSPIYFGRLKIPCHDKKPARIEPGVSQIRSFLWNPVTQQSHFAMLNDGDMGTNKWIADCFEKWTYKKNVTGYDFKHFQDDEFTHPLDCLRYLCDPWIADMRVAMTAIQPRTEASTEIAAMMGDQEAYAIKKQKEQLKQQITEYFGAEHGLSGIFDTEEKIKQADLPIDQQRNWTQLIADKDKFIPQVRDPNEAEPLAAQPKGRIRFRF
jgi:hypothetical protein